MPRPGRASAEADQRFYDTVACSDDRHLCVSRRALEAGRVGCYVRADGVRDPRPARGLEGRPRGSRSGAAKQRAVLAVLLLHANEPVPTARLVDELWGERPPATAVKAVQVYVSQLRKALGEGVIETQPPGYVLRVEDGALDLQRFERLLERGRRLLADGAAEEAARCCCGGARALARSGAGGLPVRGVRARRDRRGSRSCGWSRSGCASRPTSRSAAPPRSCPSWRRSCASIRCASGLRELLILALYRAGRQADALAAYQDARAALVDELGLDPGEALQQLEKAILLHDPSLDLSAAAPPRICRPARSRSSSPTSRARRSCSPGSGRDEYAALLDEHRRLLRAAFADAGGREVDTQGDAFFVAFPSATGAVAGGRASAARDGATQLAGPDRDPHRRAVGRADRVRRPRRAARRADLRGRPRRAGADLAVDARAGRGRAPRRGRAARPRRAPAQGPGRGRSGSRSS